MTNLIHAIGMMSGTSLDGIDIASIRTDGESDVEHGSAASYPYAAVERNLLRKALAAARKITRRDDRSGVIGEAEDMITGRHTDALRQFLKENGINADSIDVIGFHGQTVFHDPSRRLTVQIGDARRLATEIGINVVADLRAADVAAGGQGAPLAPVYHQALAAQIPELPAAFVNIGGVANVTAIAEGHDLLAFDTGPGNALLDDWVRRHTGRPYDIDGDLARTGKCDEAVLHDLLRNPYFDQPVPKSLDRNHFPLEPLGDLSPADGAATLAHFTASTIIHSAAWFYEQPKTWVICGGGRHNRFLMELLAWYAEVPVVPAEAVGCNGDAIEAEAWAYLAVRSMKGLPITWPTTTGAPKAMTGGVLHTPPV